MYPKFIIHFVFLFGCCAVVSAQTTTYSNQLTFDQIAVNQTTFLGDPQRDDDAGVFPDINYVVIRSVTAGLVYGRENLSDVENKEWQFRIEFELYEEDALTAFDDAIVTIEHGNESGIYESKEAFTTTSGAVQLKITNIEASTDGFTTIVTDPVSIATIVPDDVRLELNMEVERYDYLDSVSSPLVGFETNNNQHNLLLKWSFIPGVTHYEIEYSYLDNEVISTPTIDEIFARATRIETAAQYLNIPVTFPEGKLYFRVRGVGRYIRNVNNDYTYIKYTDWKDGNGLSNYPVEIKPIGTANAMELEAFESERNWQYTTSFAEDGKYKKVMTYFDDGLKNRQVVTNLSTEKSVLVATSHYDVEGRPTVSILPAPTSVPTENNLFFKPNFNQGYNRNNFDKTDTNGVGNADALGTTSGAGKYYSPSNTDNGIYKNLIDDANGYPLTHMRYLNDGTGRVAAQSGVGDFHQLGTGRETEYFYDDPSSTQLHRLFGKNIGKAKYYKRQLVKDANGQFSVSYIDQAGQVVATALSGASPSNVEALDSEAVGTYTLTEDLTDNNVINEEEGISSIVTTVMHESVTPTDYVFDYDLTGITEQFDIVIDEMGNTEQLCSSCNYVIEFSISDPCGEVVQISGNDTYIQLLSGPSCAGMIPLNTINFTVNFDQIGLYKIRKTLKVIPESISYWVNIIENDPSLIPPYVVPDIDFENCAVTCEQYYMAQWLNTNFDANNLAANETLEDWFVANPTQAQQFEVAVLDSMQTDPTCGLTDGYVDTLLFNGAQGECEALWQQLVQHVSPSGCLYEYGEWWNGGANAVTGSGDFPMQIDFTAYTNGEWNDDWAIYLVQIHPEYCRWQICDDLRLSREFDLRLRLTNSFAEAATEFGLNANTDIEDYMTAVFNHDFNNNGLTSLSINFLSAIQDFADDGEEYDCDHDGDYNDMNNPGTDEPDTDNNDEISISELVECHFQGDETARWRQMVAFYLGLKEEAIDDYIEDYIANISNGDCVPIDEVLYPALANCTIFQDNLNIYDEFDGITDEMTMQNEGEMWIINNVNNSSAICDCEEKVAGWVQIIENNPDFTGCSLSQSEIDLLEDFCEEYVIPASCPNAVNSNNTSDSPNYNPFGYLLNDDVTAGLSNFPNGCIFDALIADVIVSYDEVYEQQVNPCFEEILVAFNDPAFNCPSFTVPYLSGETLCYDQVVIDDVDDNLIIACYAENTTSFDCSTSAQRASTTDCGNCLNFSFFQYNGNWLPIDACDIEAVSNIQMVASPNLNATPSDGQNIYHNSSDQDLVGVDLLVNGNLINGYALFLSDCINPCISTLLGIPNEISINLDSTFFACANDLIAEANLLAEQAYDEAINNLAEQFFAQTNCFGNGFAESFSVEHPTTEHHYTLYYYDQAGNLVQTVPPAGVQPLTGAAFSGGVWNGISEPEHKMETQYTYNSIGQAVWQQTPDGGVTTYEYDFAQRLRLSQNDKQREDAGAANDFYSYTRYDQQGRIAEVGQLEGYNPSITDLNNISFPDGNNGTLNQWTKTYYDGDDGGANVTNFTESNLRGRVSKTENEHIETFYSYDVHGNIQELLHKYDGILGNKKVRYDYDLISGNVNQVTYQPDAADCFIHRYCYDADNRITEVWTSEDGVLWENDARYFYYKHGPLARMEIGNDKVQGMDYYYTLQGWIKGVNMPGNDANQDPGKDGLIGAANQNRFIPKDEMSYVLGYYQGDYNPIGGNYPHQPWDDLGNDVLSKNNVKGLFNGNIAYMTTDLQHFGATTGLRTMAYKYDALHRIKSARSYDWDGNNWTNNNTQDNTNYSYDPNGNIDSLSRASTAFGGFMDMLSYDYETDANGDPLNRLAKVTEGLPTATPTDLGDFKGTHEYTYDAIGNLIKDEVTNGNADNSINNIEWTVYGKVAAVDNAVADNIEYTYDAAGNRLTKEKINTTPGNERTYYVRDASGNVLSIYELNSDSDVLIEPGDLMQKEVPLYGSSRLGLKKFDSRQMPIGLGGMTPPPMPYERTRGDRHYELSNHLGNVLTTVSDKKTGIAGNDPDIAESYEANVLMASDYYPFGLQMPGRKFNEPSYRYGFNGKENSEGSEWGIQLVQDYGFRLYNPGIGKFLSVDPLAQSYPWYTPYQFAGNKPIAAIDLDGLEEWYAYDKLLNAYIKVPNEISPGPINIQDANARNYFTLQQAQGKVVFESNYRKYLLERSKRIAAYQAESNFRRHKALSSNPIWNFYQISGIADGVSILNYVSNKEYETAAIMAGLFILPNGLLAAKRSYGTLYIGKYNPNFKGHLQLEAKSRAVISLRTSNGEKQVEGLIGLTDENLLTGNFMKSKNARNSKVTGLSDDMLDLSVGYFGKDNVKGVDALWVKNKELYSKVGGQSVNLTIFENALKNGDSLEEAAFQTITGDWAKNNGFTKAIVDPVENGYRVRFVKPDQTK